MQRYVGRKSDPAHAGRGEVKLFAVRKADLPR
jgi:hypothetical protein